MRILFDGRLLDSNPSGVRDIAEGLVLGLSQLERIGRVELAIARTTRRHESMSLRLPSSGFMQVGLPLAALACRADRILVPRQTKPPFSVVESVPFFHDIGFLVHPHLYSEGKRIALTTRVAARSKFGLAVSEFTAGEMSKYGLGNSIVALPIQAVHHIDWKPSTEDRYVLCVAAQEPHKNLLRLLQAWELADTQDVRLVLCGRRGADSARIDEFISQTSKGASIEVQSGLDDLSYAHLLENCMGYVQPSLYEGLCIPALDMAAAGSPTIVSSSANLGSVFAQSSPHQVFDPMSPIDIATSLEHLISDESFRQASAAFNLSAVKETDWTRVAELAIRGME